MPYQDAGFVAAAVALPAERTVWKALLIRFNSDVRRGDLRAVVRALARKMEEEGVLPGKPEAAGKAASFWSATAAGGRSGRPRRSVRRGSG